MPLKLQERLLSVLDKKHHWAWPFFAEGKVPLDQLKIHFALDEALRHWLIYRDAVAEACGLERQ